MPNLGCACGYQPRQTLTAKLWIKRHRIPAAFNELLVGFFKTFRRAYNTILKDTSLDITTCVYGV